MAKKRRESSSGLDRVFELVEEAPAGLHDLEEPSADLPAGLPEPLIELYARCDGGRLYHDTITIAPAREVVMHVPGRWQFAAIEEDSVAIDHRGRVWRTDSSLDDDICEGTKLERWLSGSIDAIGLLYD